MHTPTRLTLLATFFSLSVGSAFPQPTLPDPLRLAIQNHTSWIGFKWSVADQSSLWTDKRWSRRLVEGNKAGDATHSRTLDAYGYTWEASLWKGGSSAESPRLSISTQVTAQKCGESVLAVGRDMGQGLFSEESESTYFSETSFNKLVIHKYQWTIGTTRVDALCAGTQSYSSDKTSRNDDTLLLNVTFGSIDSTPLLQPSILLRCSRKSVLLGLNGRETTNTDLVVWVDQSANIIRNSEFSLLADKEAVSINENSIRFTILNKATEVRYVINRLTGALTGDGFQAGAALARLSGNCERASSKAKF